MFIRSNEFHSAILSKLLAGREKDIEFVQAMLNEDLVSVADIQFLAPELDGDTQARLTNALRNV